MKYIHTIIILILIILVSSCRKDFDTSLSSGDLVFSKDTLFFNRVFDNISSSTHRFTVKNKSDNAITIPKITLANGLNSFYRLNVDGISGKEFNNIDVLANDSIYVFVEVTVDFQTLTGTGNELKYTDDILFDAGTNEQKVNLEALIKDVNLIRPNRTAFTGTNGFDYEEIILGQNPEGEDIKVRGTNLTTDTTWGNSNENPYLIYNYVGVPSGKTLTIVAGTQLHFHANSGIIVQDGGKLIVEGTLDNKVVFQGDRLEEFYNDVAGQWGTIWLMEGSNQSKIEHAIIKNATLGLLVDSNNATNTNETLTIYNSEIYNTTSYGLLSRNANILAKNMVISNNGQSSFSTQLGGIYNVFNSTLANYWRNSNRQEATLFLSSILGDFENDLTANFTNCIVDGSQNLEFLLEKGTATNFNFQFTNCMLKFNDTSNQYANEAIYDFSDTSLYNSIYLNENADFKNTNSSEDPVDLRIGDNSFANGKADFTIINSDIVLQQDLLGVIRTNPADLGAFNHITFTDED